MSIEDKAKFIMAVRNYECEDIEKWDQGVDFTALNTTSDEKILLRVIEAKSKSEVVGVDEVRKMVEVMERRDFDGGFLIGKKFSDAAKQEMTQNKIRKISDKSMPLFKPEKLILRINEYTDNLCEVKCGKIPKKEGDCQGYSNGRYSCNIRTISDNASFHFERGWLDLLKNDFQQLLSVHDALEK